MKTLWCSQGASTLAALEKKQTRPFGEVSRTEFQMSLFSKNHLNWWATYIPFVWQLMVFGKSFRLADRRAKRDNLVFQILSRGSCAVFGMSHSYLDGDSQKWGSLPLLQAGCSLKVAQISEADVPLSEQATVFWAGTTLMWYHYHYMVSASELLILAWLRPVEGAWVCLCRLRRSTPCPYTTVFPLQK